MLNILSSGLSLEGKELLQKAISEAFGEGNAELVDLNKENLRQRVRLSQRNVADALVILDGVSTDLCKDIENGLYASDKFYTYSDDESLVEFLNSKYGLSLAISKSEMEVSSSTDSADSYELEEKYAIQLADKNLLIQNLTARVKELTNLIELGDYSESDFCVNNEELDLLKQENLDLRNQLLNATSTETSNSEIVVALQKERDSLKITIENLEKKRDSILSDLSSVTAELTDYKVKYSTQNGLLRSKESELELLKSKVATSTEFEGRLKALAEEKKIVENTLTSLQVESANLKVDLSTKDAEIIRLQTELSSKDFSSDERSKLKEEIQEITLERDTLAKKVSRLESSSRSADGDLDELSNQINSLLEENSNLQEDIDALNVKIKSIDDDLMQANKEKLEMQGKLSVLEASTNRDTDIESIMSEVTDLRQKYDSLSGSVFSKISSVALPKGSTKIHLTRGGANLPHVRFAFAGSTESRKGAYKCLLDEFRQMPKTEKLVIVDVVSETSIDYVFEIDKVVSGIDWFRKGGGIQKYLSSTCLSTVSVLSAGLGYLNDSYFLTVDWERRLTELENSGYNVVVFFGDISNIIGRVFHESFADLGTSIVYVHGNAIGSRTIVSNLMGLSNSSKSVICYFEFNKQMQRFYEMVSKTNECRILSIS